MKQERQHRITNIMVALNQHSITPTRLSNLNLAKTKRLFSIDPCTVALNHYTLRTMTRFRELLA